MSATIKRLNNGYARLIRVLRAMPAQLPARLRAAKPAAKRTVPEAESAKPGTGGAKPKTKGAELETESPAPKAAPPGPPIEPRELPVILKRLSRDSRIVLAVAVLVVVLITTLAIGIPAALDRMALHRRLAARDADVAAYRSRIVAMKERDTERGKFVRRFTAQFMDPQVYKAAATRTATFKPDGLDEEGTLIRSMLWQLKSHRGTARFLAARKSIELTVLLDGELPKVEWREFPSPLPALLEKLGITPTDRAIRALNIQINRYGFTNINGRAVIARDVDGKLVIVKPR